MAVGLYRRPYLLWSPVIAPLHCRDGARRVFTDRGGDIACARREAKRELFGESYEWRQLHPTKNRF